MNNSSSPQYIILPDGVAELLAVMAAGVAEGPADVQGAFIPSVVYVQFYCITRNVDAYRYILTKAKSRIGDERVGCLGRRVLWFLDPV